MTIALWCVLIAGLLHLPFSTAAKSGKGFDNANPRDYLAGVQGWRKRSHAAHLNMLESFPLFAAAVLTAEWLDASQNTVDGLAIAFIVLRLLFAALYIANLATLRSLTWVAATGCSIALFVIAA